MQVLTATISALCLSVWDLAMNHGEFTRLALAAASHVVHTVGL